MEITLKTLTPLWTGGVDGATDRLHETSLIGSLRWWYEALVRGLGGYACDPTSDDRCLYDPTNSKPPEEQVCPACYLFGCTGWARKFRLRVSDGQKLLEAQNVLIPSGRVHQSKRGPRAGGWFVFSESRHGNITLDLVSLRDADLRPIHTILALIGQHASLGPKGASGYGVIQSTNMVLDLEWRPQFGRQTPPRSNRFPDFRDFFFAKFRFDEPSHSGWWKQIKGIKQASEGQLDDKIGSPPPLRQALQELTNLYNQGILPIAPAIRNWLRYEWEHGLSAEKAHFIFGEARAVCPHCYQPGFQPDKRNPKNNWWCPGCKKTFEKGMEIPTTASKIYVSYAYRINETQWEFRIWGWLPCNVLNERDDFLSSLKVQLRSEELWKDVFDNTGVTPRLIDWHALNCTETDGYAYLNKLLGGAQ